MSDTKKLAPEHTAERVALWRALHVLLDPKPHILTDDMGLKILAPPAEWTKRPDMDPVNSRRARALIVGRSRFIEDLVEEQIKKGITQYVILGAGIDTFAQRRPELASKLKIFEIDQAQPQEWKKQRLTQMGFYPNANLNFVPVNFESGESWWEKLLASGFDSNKPAVVASTGVTMYLTKETNIATFKQMAKLAPGSTFATTFMLTFELLEDVDKPVQEFTMKMAKQSGTPFISFFSPEEILAIAKSVGFKTMNCVSQPDIRSKYFANRADGLCSASAENFLVATT